MNYTIAASIAVIPPRLKNGTVRKCINALLNQSYSLDKIYLCVPTAGWQRWRDFDFDAWFQESSLPENVVPIYCNFDSPLLKYYAPALHNVKCDFLFVGDDDQEYNEKLIENMVFGIRAIDGHKYVYQNRYDIVKHGTAGIIHGFVGLMMSPTLLQPLLSFPVTLPVWVDDQLMSIYFHKQKTPIISSGVNDFDDIFKTLGINGMEKLRTGGDLCLDPVTGDRMKQIMLLEKQYDVYFVDKGKNYSKGRVIDVKWNSLSSTIIHNNVHICHIGPMTKEMMQRVDDIINCFPNFIVNLWNEEYWETRYGKSTIMTLSHMNQQMMQRQTERMGMDIVDEFGGVFVSLNAEFDIDTFSPLQMILDSRNVYYDDNGSLLLYSNCF